MVLSTTLIGQFDVVKNGPYLDPMVLEKQLYLKLITEQGFSPDNGEIIFGTKLKICYFDQLRDQLDKEKIHLG